MRTFIISNIIVLFSCFAYSQTEYTMEQVIDRVLSENFGIKIAKLDVEIAKNENNPGAAGYLPTIDIDATQNFEISSARQEFLTGDVNEAKNANNKSFSAGALLNWTFFDGFKMFATDKKLDELERMSELNLRAAMEVKIYETVINYYTLLSLQEMNDVYTGAIELSLLRRNFIKNQYEGGAANKIQLVQAELDLTADSAAYLANQQSISQVKATLTQLLSLSPTDEFSVSGDLSKQEDLQSWEEIVEQFSEQNTSIMQAKSAIAVSELSKKEAQSRFYPQLSFYASYNYGNAVNQVGFLASNRSYGPSFGITAKWNILSHLSRVTELKNAKINEERTALALQNDSITVLSDLRNYYDVMQFAQEKLAFELRNIDNTRSIADITEKALSAGSITPLELREIQYTAIQAEGRLLQSQIEYQTARLNISLLSGKFQSLL